MNRLQKKAMSDLYSAVIVTVGVILTFMYLTYADVRDGDWIRLLSVILIGSVSGEIAGYYKVQKLNKTQYTQFDERELLLIKQAYEWFTAIFISYLLLITVIVFMAFGGKGTLTIWKLPVFLLSGLFLSQCVASFYLLRCARESDE